MHKRHLTSSGWRTIKRHGLFIKHKLKKEYFVHTYRARGRKSAFDTTDFRCLLWSKFAYKEGVIRLTSEWTSLTNVPMHPMTISIWPSLVIEYLSRWNKGQNTVASIIGRIRKVIRKRDWNWTSCIKGAEKKILILSYRVFLLIERHGLPWTGHFQPNVACSKDQRIGKDQVLFQFGLRLKKSSPRNWFAIILGIFKLLNCGLKFDAFSAKFVVTTRTS